jgi:thiamine kinase-like enzyme
MLQDILCDSFEALSPLPHQALHGDAHLGNLMNTTRGLLWTDWEDSFQGPVEWDIASAIWNAKVLEEDVNTVEEILAYYCRAGGNMNEEALDQCLVARAAVITAWYPILYPRPDAERRTKLQRRLEWLEARHGLR